MTTQERIANIESFLNKEVEKQQAEELQFQKQFQTEVKMVESIQPKIKELLEVARACQKNKINLFVNDVSNGFGHKNSFFADAFLHKVGFITDRNTKQIVGVGIMGGGCCGIRDLIVTESEILYQYRDTPNQAYAVEKFAPKTYNKQIDYTVRLERFAAMYPNFEKLFYDYVDGVCSGKYANGSDSVFHKKGE